MAEDNYAKNAAQDKLNRDEYAGYLREKAKEKEENEAPRKAISDAYDYVKGKVSNFGQDAINLARKNLGFKHGGATTCKMSTHVPKKNANW